MELTLRAAGALSVAALLTLAGLATTGCTDPASHCAAKGGAYGDDVPIVLRLGMIPQPTCKLARP